MNQANDSILSWASGNHHVSTQLGDDNPYDASVAGIDGDRVAATASAFNNVRTVPDCSEGNCNMADIISGGRG
jgi:hypothetical protein